MAYSYVKENMTWIYSGLLGAKPAPTPMDHSHKIDTDFEPLISNPTSFRSLIGKLLCFTHTILDINFVVCKLSQFLSKPTATHFQVILRILKYIKLTIVIGLLFKSNSSTTITGFTDSDWGCSCTETHRSTTGFCFYIESSLFLFFKSKKHHIVSRSSSEVEYRAFINATCEARWLLFLLNDLSIQQTNSIIIFCNNRSIIHIGNDLLFHVTRFKI